jgi:hypothetical protein
MMSVIKQQEKMPWLFIKSQCDETGVCKMVMLLMIPRDVGTYVWAGQGESVNFRGGGVRVQIND